MTFSLIACDTLEIEDLVHDQLRLVPTDLSGLPAPASWPVTPPGFRLEPSAVELDVTCCELLPITWRRSIAQADYQATLAEARWRDGRLLVVYDLERVP